MLVAAVAAAVLAGCGGNGTVASPASRDLLVPQPEVPSVVPEQAPVELPGQARWQTYATRIKETGAHITVDTSMAALAPDPTRPQLLVVMVEMLEPDEAGLKDQSPRSRLAEIHQAIQQRLTPALSGHYVGSVTREGTVEHYVYVPAGVDCDATVESVERMFPRHSWLAYPQDDPQWESYTDLLLPTPADLERVRNQRVLEHLAALGDNHVRARPVDHFCAFPAHTNAKAFAKAVLAAGFEPLLIDPSAQSDPVRRFEVRVRHVDAVSIEAITAVTLRLRGLAGDHFGAYDTWGCPVVK